MASKRPGKRPPEKSPGDAVRVSEAHFDALSEHYEKWFGAPNVIIYHERLSEAVHLDTLIYPPTETRPHITAATIGMSSRPVNCGHGHKMRAELLMYLKPNWDFGSPIGHIPISLLHYVARYPHAEGDSFNTGYTYEAPYRPIIEGSLLTDLFIRRPVYENMGGEFDDFAKCSLPNGKVCGLNWLIPITMEECYVKRSDGVEALAEILTDNNYFTLDVDRRSFVGSENRHQRRAREKAQRLREKRPPAKGWGELECIAHGYHHERP